MIVSHDGADAISYEPAGGTIRLLSAPPVDGEARPAYFGAGQVRPLWGGVAMLSAFHGHLSRAHMRLIVRLLLDHGYRVLYAERTEGHTMPFATEIAEGDFRGLFRIELTEVPHRRRADA